MKDDSKDGSDMNQLFPINTDWEYIQSVNAFRALRGSRFISPEDYSVSMPCVIRRV